MRGPGIRGMPMSSRVETLRKARGWSRLDLATRATVTESTIIRAERTNPPALQTRNLEKIAHALDVSLSDLLDPPDDDPRHHANGEPDPDVLLIHDLAYELRSTVRRLRAILKTEPWKLPERLPAIDKRDRWSRVAVERWLEYRDQDRKRRTAAALVGR
jgi:transcriptional regulator with XRE-family HTH domain